MDNQNKQQITKQVEMIEQLIEMDSYTLTRDEQDALFYAIQPFKAKVEEIYGAKK